MSQKAALAELDREIHAALHGAGLSDRGIYTPSGGAGVPCEVYVDRSVQEVGDLGQLRAGRTEVTYVLSSMGGTMPADKGILVVDGDTLTNTYEISNDGSLSRWLVRGG